MGKNIKIDGKILNGINTILVKDAGSNDYFPFILVNKITQEEYDSLTPDEADDNYYFVEPEEEMIGLMEKSIFQKNSLLTENSEEFLIEETEIEEGTQSEQESNLGEDNLSDDLLDEILLENEIVNPLAESELESKLGENLGENSELDNVTKEDLEAGNEETEKDSINNELSQKEDFNKTEETEEEFNELESENTEV